MSWSEIKKINSNLDIPLNEVTFTEFAGLERRPFTVISKSIVTSGGGSQDLNIEINGNGVILSVGVSITSIYFSSNFTPVPNNHVYCDTYLTIDDLSEYKFFSANVRNATSINAKKTASYSYYVKKKDEIEKSNTASFVDSSQLQDEMINDRVVVPIYSNVASAGSSASKEQRSVVPFSSRVILRATYSQELGTVPSGMTAYDGNATVNLKFALYD